MLDCSDQKETIAHAAVMETRRKVLTEFEFGKYVRYSEIVSKKKKCLDLLNAERFQARNTMMEE